MTNADRRRLLDQFRASGMEGSILDVYKAYAQGRDIIAEHKQQQEANKPLVAETPQEQKDGLRPYQKPGITIKVWFSQTSLLIPRSIRWV